MKGNYERRRASRFMQGRFESGYIKVRPQGFRGGYVEGLGSWFPSVRARAQEQFQRDNQYTYIRNGM